MINCLRSYLVLVVDKNLIEARYDAVEEYTEDVDTFTSLRSALDKLPDIEKVIFLCIQLPRS